MSKKVFIDVKEFYKSGIFFVFLRFVFHQPRKNVFFNKLAYRNVNVTKNSKNFLKTKEIKKVLILKHHLMTFTSLTG